MTQSDHPIIALAKLPRQEPVSFSLNPPASAYPEIADRLNLIKVKKLRFTGDLTPTGKTDWRLDGVIGATVTQACVITQEPVTTRIDEPVIRKYLSNMPEPDGDEDEMPEDDSLEPLQSRLDLSTVLEEALALALPLYPKAPGAELGQAVFAGPGVAPMTDEDTKPLAGLAALKARMEGSEDPSDEDEEPS